MSRRRLLRGVAAVVTASCVGRRRAGDERARLAMLVPASEREVWAALARSFEAQNPTVQVRLIEGPNSTDLRENLYSASLLAADDNFDLVLMDVTWTAKFASAGWLRPLDSAFTEADRQGFLRQALDAGRYAGSLFRIPTRTDVGVLYYRRDWLEAAGRTPPRTFAELVATARALQDPPARWGFVWPGSQYEGLVCFFLEVLRGYGGRWIDPAAQEVDLDGPRSVAALEFLRECRLGSRISPPGVTTYKEEESRRLFHDGRAAFLRNWPYVWRLAQAGGSPIAGRVGVQAMVSETGDPGSGTLGGWGLGVSRFARDPERAVSFIRHATSIEGQRLLCSTSGYVPSLAGAFEDAELLAANPFLGALRAIHESAAARPALPRYALASDILQRALSAALAGLATPRDALRRAARETRALIHSRTEVGP